MPKVDDFVSIIMPAHNSSKHIEESINSVLEQSYDSWELIIINDRSTDNTLSIAEGYQSAHNNIIVYSNHDTVGGAYYARNIGLSFAKGRYICFLDSDDVWLPFKLEVQIDAMKKYNVFASHGCYNRISESGSFINQVNIQRHVSYKDQLKSNRIPNLTGIYDRSKIGLFEQNKIGHEDYEMWLRILRKTSSIGIEKAIASYRVSENSLSSNKLQSASWHYRILSSVDGLSYFQRWFYFFIYLFYAVLKRI
ncbi:glycosyltransferase family 2 protein [Vibrio cyclitrophicus]